MSKKMCKKLTDGEPILRTPKAKYFCKGCEATSKSEKDLCKPGKIKAA